MKAQLFSLSVLLMLLVAFVPFPETGTFTGPHQGSGAVGDYLHEAVRSALEDRGPPDASSCRAHCRDKLTQALLLTAETGIARSSELRESVNREAGGEVPLAAARGSGLQGSLYVRSAQAVFARKEQADDSGMDTGSRLASGDMGYDVIRRVLHTSCRVRQVKRSRFFSGTPGDFLEETLAPGPDRGFQSGQGASPDLRTPGRAYRERLPGRSVFVSVPDPHSTTRNIPGHFGRNSA
ncbi:MAG: hypothetical protein AVO35_05790 [Candidatus Aegiribacteria sp. MLS_C]|nr:MAG: hypothetical protein AVO35_05790 [Candidatus Aegiribacteria sp. MLS_C]